MQNNDTQQVSAWARDSWAWCARYGLLDGERPLDKLTREEFAITILRMIGR